MHTTLLDHLNSPYRRKIFFGISALIVVLLAVVNFFVLPALPDQSSLLRTLSQIVSAMFTAAVSSVATTAALLFFSPPPEPQSGTAIVRPVDRGGVIEQTRHDADNWCFSGGLGRYTRARQRYLNL